MEAGKQYSIGEIADLAGVSRRTIRYYVQRGLVPPPPGAGRGHSYTGEHLQRLLSIKLLQDRGLSLEEIEASLRGGPAAAKHPRTGRQPQLLPDEPDASAEDVSLWTRLKIAEGVELSIEGGRYRLSPRRLLQLRRAVKSVIGDPFAPEGDEPKGDEGHG